MRGVIVPPSKLIVKQKIPKRFFVFIRGGLLLRGGDYIEREREREREIIQGKEVFDSIQAKLDVATHVQEP